MDEGISKASFTQAEKRDFQENLSGKNVASPTSNPRGQSGQRNMEFAPMPSQSFGHLGTVLSPFDMRHMSNTLPDYPQSRYIQPQFQASLPHSSALDTSIPYVTAPNQQYSAHVTNPYFVHSQQTHPQLQRAYSGYDSNVSGSPPNTQAHPQMYSQQQNFPYATNMPQHVTNNLAYTGQRTQQYIQNAGRMPANYHVPRLEMNHPQTGFMGYVPSHNPQPIRRNSSNSSLNTSTTLRGPPRKPKQSGHALWIGNLPPGTQILDLKDHFSRDATDEIESVFLISKSNCAFVNYKSEESCTAAMARFHDSRFHGVRLVCRLRRSSGANISPSAPVEALSPKIDVTESLVVPVLEQEQVEEVTANATHSFPTKAERLVKEKFFIIKSLTMDDLERSVNSGIWATQAHNEENLNLAFMTAENVYLVFSANKSGEYFGYARMESRISAEAVPISEAENIEPQLPAVIQPSPTSKDVPLKIATSATSTAPRGHIIDDSSRGTIFWEAESSNLTPSSAIDGTSGESAETSGEDTASKANMPQQSAFGKPFKISWQSTERLPFYRTRGLRNPWNANREVKIARDGTELEPNVGRKLIGMFEQQAQINLAARASGPPQFNYTQPLAQYHTGMMPQAPYGYHQGPNHGYGY